LPQRTPPARTGVRSGCAEIRPPLPGAPTCAGASGVPPSRPAAASRSGAEPAAGVPFARVTADSVYGVGELEMRLRGAGKGYVLGVSAGIKKRRRDRPHAIAHPLVNSGNPPHRHPARTTAHPPCPRHRLVMLATRPSGHRPTLTSETENATAVIIIRTAPKAAGELPDGDSALRTVAPLPRR
jgi:hypothetical protein